MKISSKELQEMFKEAYPETGWWQETYGQGGYPTGRVWVTPKDLIPNGTKIVKKDKDENL